MRWLLINAAIFILFACTISTAAIGDNIVTHKVVKASTKYHYKIDVAYPQISNAGRYPIIKLNRLIKQRVYKIYHDYEQNVLPSKQLLKQWPDFTNSIDMTYQIKYIDENIISIYFEYYYYSVGSAHPNQSSFTINYYLKTGRIIRLRDMLRAGDIDLKVVSSFCDNYYKTNFPGEYNFIGNKLSNIDSYYSYNITGQGIEITFDKCDIISCMNGKQVIKIDYKLLKFDPTILALKFGK